MDFVKNDTITDIYIDRRLEGRQPLPDSPPDTTVGATTTRTAPTRLPTVPPPGPDYVSVAFNAFFAVALVAYIGEFRLICILPFSTFCSNFEKGQKYK